MKTFFENNRGKEKAFSFYEKSVKDHHHAVCQGLSPAGNLNGRVLILNQSYEPISICSVKKALVMVFLRKADIIAERKGRMVRTSSSSFPFPGVIRLQRYIRMPYRKVELSRRNIMRRDGNKCQYCGRGGVYLTIDHVLPKSRGGKDSWENLVAACIRCNSKKGNRTPEEANMPLLNKPYRPNHLLFLKLFMDKVEDCWKPFLFFD